MKKAEAAREIIARERDIYQQNAAAWEAQCLAAERELARLREAMFLAEEFASSVAIVGSPVASAKAVAWLQEYAPRTTVGHARQDALKLGDRVEILQGYLKGHTGSIAQVPASGGFVVYVDMILADNPNSRGLWYIDHELRAI